MKKFLLSAFVATAASVAGYAANDRIDFYDAEGNFVSVMTDDIESMKVTRANGGSAADGYSILSITTPYGTREYIIAELPQILYTPLDDMLPHEIGHIDAENSTWVLWNAKNNGPQNDPDGPGVIDPTKPHDWRGAEYGYTVLFDTRVQKGYSDSYTITGRYTGNVYSENPTFVFISEPNNNLLGVRAFAYHMPFEPVDMVLSSKELTTYAGAEFLGDYTGCQITVGASRLAHKASKKFSIHMDANTTFSIKTTDSDKFDFLDLYTYDEDTNTFSYVPYDGDLKNEIDLEIKFGGSGRFLGDDLVLVSVNDILTDKPENTRRYLASRKNADFTIASADEFNQTMLVQVAPTDGSETRYFYFEKYTAKMTEVTMDFESGNNIGQTCRGYIMDGGTAVARYELTAGSSPIFTMRGAEYGEYNGANGKLYLDGFGKLTLGSQEGTYEINGGVLFATIAGQVTMLVVDRDARTYSEMTGDEWTGPKSYSSENLLGSYMGKDVTGGNIMTVALDRDLMGNDSPGNAAVTIKIARGDGMTNNYINAASTIGSYVYNKETNTIIITNLYLGTSPTTSARRNLVMRVSADKQSIWMDDSAEDRIYSTDRSNSYVLTGQQNSLYAPAPEPAGELAESYTSTPTLSMYGSTKESVGTLTFDGAQGQATIKVVVSIGTEAVVLDSTVDYTFDGTTVVLKGVAVNSPNSWSLNPMYVDITYTLNADGTLTTTENEIYALNDMIPFAVIDLSSSPFVPAE